VHFVGFIALEYFNVTPSFLKILFLCFNLANPKTQYILNARYLLRGLASDRDNRSDVTLLRCYKLVKTGILNNESRCIYNFAKGFVKLTSP